MLLTAKLGNSAARHLIGSNGGNRVLVNRLQLRVVLDFSLEIHLPEHVQGRLLALLTVAGTALGLDSSNKLPAPLASLEAERLAIVSGGNDLIFSLPDQALEGKKLGGNAQNGPRGLLWTTGVDNRDAAIMGSKCKGVSAGRKGHGVDPAGRVVQVFSADGVERQALAPDTRLGTLIDTLDKGREHSGMSIGRASSQEDGVGVPSNAGDGTANRLLQVLRNPPVIFLLKVADGNHAVAGAHGKLGLGRRPSNKRSGAADSKKDKGGLVSGRRGLPDQRISICEASVRRSSKEAGKETQ